MVVHVKTIIDIININKPGIGCLAAPAIANTCLTSFMTQTGKTHETFGTDELNYDMFTQMNQSELLLQQA